MTINSNKPFDSMSNSIKVMQNNTEKDNLSVQNENDDKNDPIHLSLSSSAKDNLNKTNQTKDYENGFYYDISNTTNNVFDKKTTIIVKDDESDAFDKNELIRKYLLNVWKKSEIDDLHLFIEKLKKKGSNPHNDLVILNN